MKSHIIVYLALFCLLGSLIAKTKNKKSRNTESASAKQPAPAKTMEKMNTKPVHISQMMIGNPNTMAKDRSPLWKDFRDSRFDRPFMHGVVGPQWSIPLAENSKGFDIISSPMPKPNMATRVIAKDFPAKTYSPTAWDLPLRKDVVQTQIPASVTRTIETSSDPRSPPKKAVKKVAGTLYHGTGSSDPRVIHGIETNFIQNKIKSKEKKARKNNKRPASRNVENLVVKSSKALREQGVQHAKKAFDTSSAVLGGVGLPTPSMVLDVKMTNKREHPDVRLYENNEVMKKRVDALRKTPAGVRAAHTPRRFP